MTVQTRAIILIILLTVSLLWTTYNWQKEREHNDAVFDMVTREWYGTNLEGIYGLLWMLNDFIETYLKTENEPYYRISLSCMVGGTAIALSRAIKGMTRYCSLYCQDVAHFDNYDVTRFDNYSSTFSRAIEMIDQNYPRNTDEQFMTDFYTNIKPYVEQLLEYADIYNYETAETPYEVANRYNIFLQKAKTSYYGLFDLIVDWPYTPYTEEVIANIA